MAQNQQSTPALTPATTTTPGAELLQAQAELWCHTFGFLKSMALQCAIKLGIPNTISRHGGAASLSQLCAALPVAPSKRTCLSRLMKLLATSGIFREEKETTTPPGGEGEGLYSYHLTAVSRLLVDDGDGGHPCLSALMATFGMPFHVLASLRLAEWLENDDGGVAAETPFTMAHGTGYWGVVGRDAEFAADFYAGMRADSRFVARIVVSECREVFAGVNSLVDVGGGDGTMAKAIAKAFPHVRCSVLELPQVVRGMQGGEGEGTVEFIAGDMMDFIPPADAVLLKFIFHDWSDEDSVKILKQCKQAISTREPKGKVIIVDTVIGSTSKRIFKEAQLLMDLNMMMLVPGKERDEENWRKMFMDAGFTKYKISPILEPRSLIEVYP